MFFRLLLVVLAALSLTILPAQDFSNKGRDFWIAYPAHIDGNQSVMGIYITSDANATGTIQVGPSGTVPFTVVANQVTRKFLGSSGPVDASNSYVLVTQQDGVKTNAAIHILSDRPVVVYTHIIRSARSGATLALPTPVLGLEYIAPSNSSIGGFPAAEQQGIGEVTVVATQPNTVIEVTPAVPGRAGRPARVPFQVTLPAAGDVYQFQGMQNADISGTRIRSVSGSTSGCKPVAVFSATTWSAFDCTSASGGDNLYQQLFPTRTWGKRFITAPFINRPYDLYRVFVNDATTRVTVTNNGVASVLNAGSYNATGGYYSIKTSNPLYIEADKPISVVQYIVSQNCKSGCTTNSSNPACQADPDMIILNPVEQTLQDITFFSAHQNYVPQDQTQVTQHFVNVIIDKRFKGSVRIDSKAPSGNFVDIPGTSYAYLQENISLSSAINPVHHISADSSFSAIVYGYGQVESYGYNGGTNIKDLYQYVTLQNQYASIDFPATCSNSPFFFSITLPYKPTSLQWDFGSNAKLLPNETVINNSPQPDSVFTRDGRTLYTYKLSDTYKFTQVGTYPVRVFANNPTTEGCEGIQEINYDVLVYEPPVADFAIGTTGCHPDSVFFGDKSFGNGRRFTSWLWTLGDGTKDSVSNPAKWYAAAGTYTIGLRSITDIGCVADTTKTFLLSPRPVASFTTKGTYCVNGAITFTDSSQVAIGSIVRWYWTFGDGKTISATSNAPVTHQYTLPGTYTATLVVEGNTNCTSLVYSKTVVIQVPPIINFSLPGVCLPGGVAMFSNQSTSPNGDALTYLWQFGDNTTDTAKNPLHVYTRAGPYQVRLQATSTQGCTNDSVITFSNIFARPKAAFAASAQRICSRDSIRLSGNSTAPGSNVAQWFWTFGDGTTSTAKDAVKTFATGGTYTIAHYIKSAAGCVSDTQVVVIQVDTLPVARFNTPPLVCAGKQVLFADVSVAYASPIKQWFWTFGNGQTIRSDTSGNYSQVFDKPGTYTATLALRTSQGCLSDTFASVIKVEDQPIANFQLPFVCLSDAFAAFDDSSYTRSGVPVVGFIWTFNDALASGTNANTSTLKNPRHKFSATGNYPIKLSVATAAGCTDSLTKLFTVNGAVPKAQFEVLNEGALCSNTLVKIKNKSTVDFGSVTRLLITWDVQNAPALYDTITLPGFDGVFAHQYPALQTDKTYQVRVRIYSGATCMDEITKSIVVNASPRVSIPILAGICFDGAARQIQAPATGNVTGTGVWSGPGISAGGLFNPAVADTGIHPLRYVYTSATGCIDSASSAIQVWPPPAARFGHSPVTCVNGDVLFTDSSTTRIGTINKWIWNLGDQPDVVLNNNNPVSHQYAASKTYQVSLQVVTDSGCTSAVTKVPVLVNPRPQVAFTMPVICLPAGTGQFISNATIANGGEAPFAYQWTFGNGSTRSTDKNPVQYFATTGPYNITLAVTSAQGCTDSLTQVLRTIYPQPKASLTASPNDTCVGGTFYFSGSSNAATVTNWYWNFGDGATANSITAAHQYATAKSYTVNLHLKDDKGCVSDTVTRTVAVHAYPVVNAGADLFVLEGGNQVIKATATGNTLRYLWTPALYLSSDSVINPVTTPLQDVTYKLSVTGAGGCKAEDQVQVNILKALGIPNAFSPNGDGINDTWMIRYLETYPGSTVSVFNRYGQQVFYSVGYTTAWDGTMKGTPLPVGVYYYIIDPKNGRGLYKGSVTILK